MRVLCLDIDGGYGGSSRSLFESIRHLRGDVDIEIWCRRDGPVRARYEALGVPFLVTPDMPHISSLPRLSRNLYAFGRFALNWPAGYGFRRSLEAAARDRFDVIHFNHEGLFLLLRAMRRALEDTAALTMHVRTYLPSTVFSRWQYRVIAGAADRVAFITENERDRATALAGRAIEGSVIYNIVGAPERGQVADTRLARDTRLKVAVLSNYAWIRGTDRIIDVARALKVRGRTDILFLVAGNMAMPRSLPGALGTTARRGGSLEDHAREQGVGDMFRFLGHVSDPYPVLAACDALAKPTREYNPWGRDILEAMSFSKPPITIGSYDRFVEDGVTGILHSEFDAERWADEIIRLEGDRELCRRLGAAAAERVARLCDGPSRAHDLLQLWQAAASNS